MGHVFGEVKQLFDEGGGVGRGDVEKLGGLLEPLVGGADGSGVSLMTSHANAFWKTACQRVE